jgi:hypothetical protein
MLGPSSFCAARADPGDGAMDHLDELLANRDAVLRLRLHRRATTTASRGCRLAATACRYQQMRNPARRMVLWGAVAVCLEALAYELTMAARWGGYRGGFRAPTAHGGPHGHARLASLAGTARGGWRSLAARRP